MLVPVNHTARRGKRMISEDVSLGEGVVVYHPELVNLYGCRIGAGSRIGCFVEVQRGARIGQNCKISSHSFICEGVEMGDGVFVGHGVMFINDRYPAAVNAEGKLQTGDDWSLIPTRVGDRVAIGSQATILCGIRIGYQALIGAGAVVTHDVPDYQIVADVPACFMGDIRDKCPSRFAAIWPGT